MCNRRSVNRSRPSPQQPKRSRLTPPRRPKLPPQSLRRFPCRPSPTAYRDYTRKSFAEFGSFFEQLSGVRSLDKAMEVQTEFVKRAYESSVAESQKIRELHRALARQTLEPFEGITGKAPERHGKS